MVRESCLRHLAVTTRYYGEMFILVAAIAVSCCQGFFRMLAFPKRSTAYFR
ncbi:MAG: hypothetical protein AAFQ89_06630 [Cyanobacteria bacterium J06626_18]